MRQLINHLKFRLFLMMTQERYVQALAAADAEGMLAASGTLCLAYSSLGNAAYAKKWADEFWRGRALRNRGPGGLIFKLNL